MIGIYGEQEKEKQLKKLVEYSSESMEAVCFSKIEDLVQEYQKGKIEKVLLHSKYIMQDIKKRCMDLTAMGVKKEDLFITPINTINRFQYQNQPADKEELFVPIQDFVQIHGLNVHVADHCNLRCKACSHSASLVEQPVYPDPETYRKDLKRLHELCPNICSLVLLGGEPLLNPSLPEFIRISKEIYPDAGIRIITNGILLRQMNEELIDAVKEHRVKISISIYPMMKEKTEEYETFLKTQGISYDIGYFEYFEKKLVSKPYFNKKTMAEFCPECASLRDGKLNRCVTSMYIKYYNQYFHTDYPENENIDIYQENLTGQTLMKMLDQPLQMCAYCSWGYDAERIPHEQIKGKAKQEDFIIK